AIDCGRIRSRAASSLVVSGPSRSSRASTVARRSGTLSLARSLRTRRPSTIRSACGASATGVCRATVYRLPVQVACLSVADDGYKWIALSNTTLAMLLSTIDASIMLIAMPDVFRGIHLNPLQSGNSFYLLWMILGFLVVSAVLVVSLGSLGDMYGRVRMYNLGFVVYTVASLVLAVDWLHGRAGADYLIVFRIVQGVGAAFLLANTGAILTDAFPSNQRGLALGISNVVGISGQFIGLVLGGLLAPIDWRL